MLGIKKTDNPGKRGETKRGARAKTSSKLREEKDREQDAEEYGSGLDHDVNQNEVGRGEARMLRYDVVLGDYSCEDEPCGGGQVEEPAHTVQQVGAHSFC